MLRKFLVSKGASGASKASVASSFSPTPKGAFSTSISTFGTGVGQNRLYVFSTLQESEASPNIVTGMLQLFSHDVCCLLDSGFSLM